MKVSFRGKELTCKWLKYTAAPDQPALVLLNQQGEQEVTASVCLPEYKLMPGLILIKTWSENEGLLEVLVSAGLILDLGVAVPTGYVTASVCKLLAGPHVDPQIKED